MTERLIDVGGARVFVDVRGPVDAPPLVYIHGGPGMSCFDFMNVQGDRLAQRLRLIGVDQRGVLRSDPLARAERVSVDRVIDDFEAIREALGLRRWAVLGHSAGGYTAVRYAHREPESVGPILLDCPVLDGDATDRYRLPMVAKLYEEAGDADSARRCREAADSPERLTLETGFPMLRAGLGRDSDDLYYRRRAARLRLERDRARSPYPHEVWMRGVRHLPLLREAYDRPVLDLLPELGQPCALLYGVDDTVASPDQVEAFRRADIGPIEVFGDSAHFPQLEEPGRYADVVAGFVLDRYRAR